VTPLLTKRPKSGKKLRGEREHSQEATSIYTNNNHTISDGRTSQGLGVNFHSNGAGVVSTSRLSSRKKKHRSKEPRTSRHHKLSQHSIDKDNLSLPRIS
jgi:hypothetical protein